MLGVFGIKTGPARGVAGPGPQEGHLPGEGWLAAVGPSAGSFQPMPVALRFEFDGDRLRIREQTVSTALHMLRKLLDPAEREHNDTDAR